MRQRILTLLVAIMLIVAAPIMAQEEAPPMGFIGYEYNNDVGMTGLTAGTSVAMGGNWFWLFEGQRSDSGGYANAEMLYVLHEKNNFWVAGLFGTNVKITNTAEMPAFETWLMAVGASAGYWLSDDIGLASAVKWRTDDKDINEWSIWAGVTLDIWKKK